MQTPTAQCWCRGKSGGKRESARLKTTCKTTEDRTLGPLPAGPEHSAQGTAECAQDPRTRCRRRPRVGKASASRSNTLAVGIAVRRWNMASMHSDTRLALVTVRGSTHQKKLKVHEFLTPCWDSVHRPTRSIAPREPLGPRILNHHDHTQQARTSRSTIARAVDRCFCKRAPTMLRVGHALLHRISQKLPTNHWSHAGMRSRVGLGLAGSPQLQICTSSSRWRADAPATVSCSANPRNAGNVSSGREALQVLSVRRGLCVNLDVGRVRAAPRTLGGHMSTCGRAARISSASSVVSSHTLCSFGVVAAMCENRSCGSCALVTRGMNSLCRLAFGLVPLFQSQGAHHCCRLSLGPWCGCVCCPWWKRIPAQDAAFASAAEDEKQLDQSCQIQPALLHDQLGEANRADFREFHGVMAAECDRTNEKGNDASKHTVHV